MPVSFRQWWIKRVNKALEEKNKAEKEAMRKK